MSGTSRSGLSRRAVLATMLAAALPGTFVGRVRAEEPVVSTAAPVAWASLSAEEQKIGRAHV